MSNEKKAIWPWIVALMIGLPLTYVASFGPACWLVGWGVVTARVTAPAYRPILRLAIDGPESLVNSIHWYAGITDFGEFALLSMAVHAEILDLGDGKPSFVPMP